MNMVRVVDSKMRICLVFAFIGLSLAKNARLAYKRVEGREGVATKLRLHLDYNETGMVVMLETRIKATKGRIMCERNGLASIVQTSNEIRLRGSIDNTRAGLAEDASFVMDFVATESEDANISIQIWSYRLLEHQPTLDLDMTIPIYVQGYNNAPRLTVPHILEVEPATRYTLANFHFSDTDAADTDLLSLNLRADHGFLNDSSRLDFNGTVARLNQLLTSLEYRIPFFTFRSDFIHITVNDHGNTGLGGPRTTTEIILVRIADTNDPPRISVTGSTLTDIRITDSNTDQFLQVSLYILDENIIFSSLPSTIPGIYFYPDSGPRLVHLRANSDAYLPMLFNHLTLSSNSRNLSRISIVVEDTFGAFANTTTEVVVSSTPAPLFPDATLKFTSQFIETHEDTMLNTTFGSVISLRDLLAHRHHNLTIRAPLGAFVQSLATGSNFIRFIGNASRINAALNTLSYRPPTDWSGLVYFDIFLDSRLLFNRVALRVISVDDPPKISFSGESDLPVILIEDHDSVDARFDLKLYVSFGALVLSPTPGVKLYNSTHAAGSLSNLNHALSTLQYRSIESCVKDTMEVRVEVNTIISTATVDIPCPSFRQQANNALRLSAPQNPLIIDQDTANDALGIELQGISKNPVMLSLSSDHGNLSFGTFESIHPFVWIHPVENFPVSSRHVAFRTTTDMAQLALHALVYTPDTLFFGTDEISVAATSSGRHTIRNESRVSRIIHIVDVDDAPSIELLTDMLRVREDGVALYLSTALKVTDPDNRTDQLLRLDLQVDSGNLRIIKPSSFGVTTMWNGEQLGSKKSISIIGTINRINNALSRASYLNTARERLEDALYIKVYDVKKTGPSTLLLGLGTNGTLKIEPPAFIKNTQPTIDIATKDTWLYATEGSRFNLPKITINDAESTTTQLPVDVRLWTKQTGALLSFLESPLNISVVSESDGSLTFAAVPAEATRALELLSYTPPPGYCGYDFVDIFVADRGVRDSLGAKRLSTTATVRIVIEGLNRQPTIEAPTQIKAHGPTLFSPALRFVDLDEDRANCGASTLNITISASVGTLRVTLSSLLPTSAVNLISEPQGNEIIAQGLPTAINNLISSLTFIPPKSDDTVAIINISAVDSDNLAADSVVLSIDIVTSSPTTAYVLKNKDLPALLSMRENEGMPMANIFQVESELPFALNIIATPGDLTFDDRIRNTSLVLRGTMSEVMHSLDKVQYVPPAQFFGLVTIDASIGSNSTATAVIDVLAVNDAPFFSGVVTSLELSYGNPQRILRGVSIEDPDENDIHMLSISANFFGKFKVLGTVPGVRTEMNGTSVEITGRAGRINKVLPMIQFEAMAAVPDSRMDLHLSDAEGLSDAQVISVYVQIPIEKTASVQKSASAANATIHNEYTIIAEDSSIPLAALLTINVSVVSSKSIAMFIETTHGDLAVSDESSQEIILEYGVVPPLELNQHASGRVVAITGTASTLAEFLMFKTTFVPDADYSGPAQVKVGLAPSVSATRFFSIEAAYLYIESIADAPEIIVPKKMHVSLSSNFIPIPIMVNDVDVDELLEFAVSTQSGGRIHYETRNLGGLRNMSRIPPPTCSFVFEQRAAIRYSGKTATVSHFLANLQYEASSTHRIDTVSIAVIDSYDLCVSRSIAVTIEQSNGLAEVQAVKGGILLTTSEDAGPVRLPTLMVTTIGSRAITPEYVNVSLSIKHGAISSTEISLVDVWLDDGMNLGFAGSRNDANQVLDNLHYSPLQDFYGEWELSDAMKCIEADVEQACFLLAREQKKQSLEEMSVQITPIRKSAPPSWKLSTFMISVEPVNDAPIVVAARSAVRVDPGSDIAICAIAGLTVSDVDAGLVDIEARVSNGTLRFVITGGIRILERSQHRIVLRASVNGLTRVLHKSLQYSAPLENKSDRLDIFIHDLGGCGHGESLHSNTSVFIQTIAPAVAMKTQSETELLQTLEDTYAALPAISLFVEGDEIIPVTPRYCANQSCAFSETGNGIGKTAVSPLELKGSAKHGKFFIHENSTGLYFLEQATSLRLEVIRNLDQMTQLTDGREHIWRIAANVGWKRTVQRLTVTVTEFSSTPDHILQSLDSTSIRISMTHRNRSSSADATLASVQSSAIASIISALQAISSIGQVLVAIEEFGIVEPLDPFDNTNSDYRTRMSFLLTFTQNEPMPLFEVSTQVCGGTAEDGTLDEADYSETTCSSRVEYVQVGTTVSASQRITLRSNGSLQGGEFSLVFQTQPSSSSRRSLHERTRIRSALLPFNASALDVREALEFIPGIGLVDVVRSKFNEPLDILDECWCRSCKNKTNNSSQVSAEASVLNDTRVNATNFSTPVPTGAPTEVPTLSASSVVDSCNFFPHETSWDITFLTLGYNPENLVVEWSNGASDISSQKCERCTALAPEWSENLARLAGLSSTGRAEVTLLVNGTVPMDGRFALKMNDVSTPMISVAATSGHVQTAVASLDPRFKRPGALKVTRSPRSPEGTFSWTLIFDASLGGINPLRATSLDKLEGTTASIDTLFVAQGSKPLELDGSFALKVDTPSGSAVTNMVSVNAAADELQAAMSAALQKAKSDDTGVTVVSGVASWLINFSAGFGKRPHLSIAETDLKPGVALTLASPRQSSTSESFALLGAATLSPIVFEEQVFKCILSSADNSFRLRFRGLLSPWILASASPSPNFLPPCIPVVNGPCQGDHSSLQEIINDWFFKTGISQSTESILVESEANAICVTEKAPILSIIRFVGDGLEGNVEELQVIYNTSANNSTKKNSISISEDVRGTHPFVREVQRIALVPESNATVSGWFSLEFRGVRAPQVAYNASSEALEAALNSISTISGNVQVSKEETSIWSVTFAAKTPTSGDLPLLNALPGACTRGSMCSLQPELQNASVSISEVVAGVSPAWGSFALRVRPRFSPQPQSTITLQLDATATNIQNALNRLPGAGGAIVTRENGSNPLASWGPLWTIEGLDEGTELELTRLDIYGGLDYCQQECVQSINSQSHCLACATPTLRLSKARSSITARGGPSQIAAVLKNSLYRSDAHYNTEIGGLDRVLWNVSTITSPQVAQTASIRVEVSGVNDSPKIQLPTKYFVDEDIRSRIGTDLVLSDADALHDESEALTTVVTVEYGMLWLATSDRIVVIDGYRDGGGAGPSSKITLWGAPSAMTTALSTMIYIPLPNWSSTIYQTEIQRIIARGPTSFIKQTVETSANGSALVSGNFTLKLSCTYLNPALKELTEMYANSSQNASILFKNRSVSFTLSADAPAALPRNTSFEGKLQDALDTCATFALNLARDGGILLPTNATLESHLNVRAAVVRSTQRVRDMSYLWEVTLLNALNDFPLLEVEQDESGRALGLIAIDTNHGDSAPANCFASVSVALVNDHVTSTPGFTLEYRGEKTSLISFNASTSTLASALSRLPNIGNVLVTDDYSSRAVFRGIYGWRIEFLSSGHPAHIDEEPVLRAVGINGVIMSVSKLQSGKASSDRLHIKATDEHGQSSESFASLFVRPIHDPPVVRLEAESSGVAIGYEDSPIFDLFAGVLIEIDNDDELDRQVTLQVKCQSNCTITIPKSEKSLTGKWQRVQGTDESMVLIGTSSALQHLLRHSKWEPSPNFSGVEIIKIQVEDHRGMKSGTATRAVLVNAVNDAPSIAAPSLPSTVILGHASYALVAGFVVDDIDDDMLTLRLSCSYGKLSIKRKVRRTLLRWHQGDDDQGATTLQATASLSAWNQALHYLEYVAPPAGRHDEIVATVSDSGGLNSTLRIPVVLSAKSCQLLCSVDNPLKRYVAERPEDLLHVDEEIREGSSLFLAGLNFDLNVSESTTVRMVLVPRGADDADGSGDASLRYSGPLNGDAITVKESGRQLSLEATGTAQMLKNVFNEALSHTAYTPSRDFDGIARLVVEIDCDSDVSSTELWMRIASVNNPPDFITGGVLAQVSLQQASFLSIQADVRTIIGKGLPQGSTALLLSELADQSMPFFAKVRGSLEVDDDVSGLLEIEVQVAWDEHISSGDDEPQIGLSLACASGGCGVLHFAQRLGNNIGSATGAHSTLHFLASKSDANLALSSLRVVAIGDALGCWRSMSDFDTSRNATLQIRITDSGGLTNTIALGLRVFAPKNSPLSLELDSEVLQVGEDGALLSGFQVKGGLSSGADCALDSIVEVSIRADHGDFVISANLAELGISAERSDSGEYTFRGTRSGIARLLNGVKDV